MADSDLPKDALYDILSRLPIASLARFRCVCKPWCNYIDDPYLASIHVEEPVPMMLNSECATLPKRPGIVSIIESKEGNTVFEVKQDPIYRFQCEGDPIRDIGICNGMILFSECDLSCSYFLVIHPLRKERYKLPFVDHLQVHPSYANAYGLGFDDSTDTFKVVCFFKRFSPSTSQLEILYTMVHVLGTFSWRTIPHIPECYKIRGQGVFVKGLLHWVNNPIGSEMHKVIYFDVMKEEFGVTDAPPKPTISAMHQLVNIHDKLGYVYTTYYYSVKVWILKHKEWVSYCQFHCAPPLSRNCQISLQGLGCCNKDGDLIYRECYYGGRPAGRMFIYKLKSGNLHEVNIRGLEDKSEIILLYQSHLSSSIHYINKMRLPATKIDLIKATSTRTFFEVFYSLKMLFYIST